MDLTQKKKFRIFSDIWLEAFEVIKRGKMEEIQILFPLTIQIYGQLTTK